MPRIVDTHTYAVVEVVTNKETKIRFFFSLLLSFPVHSDDDLVHREPVSFFFRVVVLLVDEKPTKQKQVSLFLIKSSDKFLIFRLNFQTMKNKNSLTKFR